MAGPIELRFDVTDALPDEARDGAAVTISGWLFLPDPAVARPVAMVLTAGGSYDKRYHHAVVPGRSGYSAAEHLAGLGNFVLLTDHLGIGESSRLPDQKKATRHIAALANHAAANQFFESLAEGTLRPGLAPVPDVVRLGGGHSMGAMQTIVQQAHNRTYDAIMVIGYTAEGVHLTVDGQRIAAASMISALPAADYSLSDRAPMHEYFHWNDVPADVLAYDDSLVVEVPAGIGHDSIRSRIVSEDAGRIDVPVYICLGESDVSPAPHAEPGYYRSSPDVTLHILPRSSHCQSFAGTRHEMWERMHHWSGWIASRKLQPA